MTALPASQARTRLYPLIEEVARNGPVQVIGRRGSAMLVSLDEWNAMTETLHIASQPGVMRKIRESETEPRARMRTLDRIR